MDSCTDTLGVARDRAPPMEAPVVDHFEGGMKSNRDNLRAKLPQSARGKVENQPNANGCLHRSEKNLMLCFKFAM